MSLFVPKVWVWLVMWLFALGTVLHSANNLWNRPVTALGKDMP